jgi:hypothetical protein
MTHPGLPGPEHGSVPLGLNGPWHRRPHKSHQGEERSPSAPEEPEHNNVLEVHRDAISRQVEPARSPRPGMTTWRRSHRMKVW